MWWGGQCATLNQHDQFILATHKKVMGCGNVFSFLNESRGFVEFYRIGSRFNFVAFSGRRPQRSEPSSEALEGQHEQVINARHERSQLPRARTLLRFLQPHNSLARLCTQCWFGEPIKVPKI